MSFLDNSTVSAQVVNANRSDNITQEKQYIFTPAGLDVKLTFTILIIISAVIGFLGNVSVVHFIRQRKEKRPRTAMSSNLHYFIYSLALSDILCVSICVPIFLIHCFVDVLQSGWPCKISRFLAYNFPFVTVYNLVVISIERCILICRPTSRPLSRVAVEKSVRGAWILGFVVSCVPLITVEGIRVDLNDTHYTVICEHNRKSPLNRVILQISMFIFYVLPFVFILFTCAFVIRAVIKKKFHVATTPNNIVSAMREWRTKQRKATLLLVAIILAFALPNILLVAFNIFKLVVRPPDDFKRDFVVRTTGAILVFLNSAVNFFIHLFQLPGFKKQHMLSEGAE